MKGDCLKVNDDLGSDPNFKGSMYGLSVSADAGRIISCAPKYHQVFFGDEQREVQSITGRCELFGETSGILLQNSFPELEVLL